MRNKISRYEENQVDRFLYDLYLLWGGNLDEDMCIGEGWIVYLEGILNLMNAREEDYDIMRILHLDKEDYYGLKKELREDFLYYLECA